MSYSAKVKKITKIDDGEYAIHNYSVGLFLLIKIFEFIGAIIFFPIKVLFNMFFTRKK